MSPSIETSARSLNLSGSSDDEELLWKKELANAITSATGLLQRLQLTHHRDEANLQPDFKCLVTESFLKRMEIGNINDPLLRQILPLRTENDAQRQQTGSHDPVGDLDALVSPGLIHKYHGRVLLITTGACAVHCRYCFRRAYPYQQSSCTGSAMQDMLDYLDEHHEVEEIILSGGDPLMLDNARLRRLIESLEGIDHLHTLRFHTRLPVVLPNRINTGLLQLLKSCRLQTVMVIHANHDNELDAAVLTRLQQLHAAGVTLLNQSVLLSGVNDNADTLARLSRRLFQGKTLPYYLHLLDPVKGAMHFTVDRHTAIDLKRRMEQQLPGYLVPRLVQEIAGNEAKTAIFHI